MKNVLLIAVFFFMLHTAYGQDKKTERQQALEKAIEKQYYVFGAQSATPMSGMTRNLSAGYEVKVTKDSVISYLPYFGRAYAAPLPNAEGGIKFTSTKFNYSMSANKKGTWDISIKFNDVNDTREFTFSISQDGYGTLQVLSADRQAISFYGYVEGTK